MRFHLESRGLWQRLRSVIEGRVRQRVTRAGLGFSLTISLTGAMALLTGNNLLFLLMACLLATLLVNGFLSRLSLAGLELDFVFPEHIPARRTVSARMKLVNEKPWMPSFSIHVCGEEKGVYSSVVYFPILAGGASAEELVDLLFARRGVHRQDTFRLRSRFPFGFAEREVKVRMPREVLVYPCLDPRQGFEDILSRLESDMNDQSRGRGYDFYRIRPYEFGESVRHVDWKATAHTSAIQVREFAREVEPLVEIVLDLDVAPAGSDWFDDAVDCSAFLSWEVVRRGARLRFRTSEIDVMVPSEGDIYVILKYLALVEPRRNRPVEAPGREDSIQVVLSADPAKYTAAGWDDAHVVGVGSFTKSLAK